MVTDLRSGASESTWVSDSTRGRTLYIRRSRDSSEDPTSSATTLRSRSTTRSEDVSRAGRDGGDDDLSDETSPDYCEPWVEGDGGWRNDADGVYDVDELYDYDGRSEVSSSVSYVNRWSGEVDHGYDGYYGDEQDFDDRYGSDGDDGLYDDGYDDGYGRSRWASVK